MVRADGGGQHLLEIDGLCVELGLAGGTARALDGVSLSVREGEMLGVVGESGCGKSLTALSVMRLLPEPTVRVVGGQVRFQGQDLLTLSEAQMRALRGNKISMVFQDPMTSLNPVFTVGNQISEAVRLHQRVGRAEARDRALEMLKRVGIPAPAERLQAYPHQLSGGMRQRVMIAMALACHPLLLIADEPTTALDVTIQAQILELLKRLQDEQRLAVMLITHDLGVVAETCHEVAVMYAGRVVERASAASLFAAPAHPYTAGLLRSIPALGQSAHGGLGKGDARLKTIPGSVPGLLKLPSGCRFRDRCERVLPVCAEVDPALEEKRPGQLAACHNPVPAHG